MVDEMRKQLDALMGVNRDQQGRLKRFTDDDVCVYFLCGLCPHEMFVNTKKDLGPCPKLHSEPLKLEYETARKTKDFGFERELLRKLEEMVRDCDREVERQARRLKEEEDLKLENDPISRQIQDLQEQAERLGEEGKLDEYMVISAQIEQLKDKRNETQAQVPEPAGQTPQGRQQQQKLKVCEICGCFLSKFDSDARLADHFRGKLHSGFQAIREKIEELKSQGVASPPEDRRGHVNSTAPTNSFRAGGGRMGYNYDRPRDPYSRPRGGSGGGRRDYRDRDRDYRDRDRDRDYRDRDHRDRDHRDRRDNRDYRDRDRDRDYRDRDHRDHRDHRDRGNRDYDRDRRDRDGRDARDSHRDSRDRERSRESSGPQDGEKAVI